MSEKPPHPDLELGTPTPTIPLSSRAHSLLSKLTDALLLLLKAVVYLILGVFVVVLGGLAVAMGVQLVLVIGEFGYRFVVVMVAGVGQVLVCLLAMAGAAVEFVWPGSRGWGVAVGVGGV